MRTTRLIFSSVRTEILPETVPSILRASRRNNPRDGVTGALIVGEHRFLQVLEGDPAGLDRCFDRIRRDHRHRDIAVLTFAESREKLFPDAAMASIGAADAGAPVADLSSPPSSTDALELFRSLAQRPRPPAGPDAEGALLVLRRIHEAARLILDDHLSRRHVSPETLARLEQSLARQARHARDLHERLAAGPAASPEHLAEVLRLRDLLEEAGREVARRLAPRP